MKFVYLLFAILPGLLATPASATTLDDGSELLEPGVAFAATATAVESGTLEIAFDIAEGYYLYHDKFRFVSETQGVSLGGPLIPPGKVKEDEFFGEVETHRDTLNIRIPYTANTEMSSMVLQVVSQGCADLGVCYPPHKELITVALATQTEPSGGGLSSLLSLGGLSDGEEELLEPDQAFRIEVLPMRDGVLPVSWGIADKYFMYRDKMQFELQGADGVTLGKPQLPEGKLKDDPIFGETEIYRYNVRADLPISNLQASTEAVLHVTYQGCADIGVCYPPIKKQIPVNLTPASFSAAAASAPSAISNRAISEQDRIAESLANDSTVWVVLVFLGLGLLLAFTPCVFPMVPILSSIIVGQGENIGTKRAFSLSLAYVLAMAVTYTAAGVAVGLSGENIQIWFQTPWVLITFASIFVLLSLSMFGSYELQIPASLQSRLTNWSNSQKGGTLIGVIIMGFLSALIVGPCITAPLVGALIYIAETGDAVWGGIALFSLAIGMGIPLLLIGTSAGTLLPKAGAWMDGVKATFGIMLLALAIWMLERILPLAATMALSAMLLICSAVYMGALDPIRQGASGWRLLWKGLGISLLIYGGMLAIGAGAGGSGFIQPLQGIFSGSSESATDKHLQFEQIKGVVGLSAALERASAKNQTVMLDFYADWCISCKEMEAFTFTDPDVQARLGDTVLLQADVTPNDALDKALLKQIGIFGPPAILFFDPQGKEIPGSRVVGFKGASEFAKHIDQTFGS